MKYYLLCFILCIFLCCAVIADRLPEGVPENQVFTTSSIIDAIGAITESTMAVWQTSDAGLDELPDPYFDDNAIKSGSIAYVTYKEAIATNGGQISEVKSFSMDTHAKTEGLYNIQTEKVLTYTSQNDSHLMGEESYVLDIAGNWSRGVSDLVCVFARSDQEVIPAFCNKVTASSKLMAMTTAQVESVGAVTAVGSSPAALLYDISVTPDANSASGYAEGIVSTIFTVSVMEGRSDGEVREIDPLSGGGWHQAGPGLQFWSGSAGGVTDIFLSRDVLLMDSVRVHYNRNSYNIGPILPDQHFTPGQEIVPCWQIPSYPCPVGSTFLPPEAGVTIIAPRGDSSDTIYTLIVQGATYLVDTSLGGKVTMITPAGYTLEHYNELASTITAIDTATVSGGISQFVKAFSYQSGVNCDECVS